MVQNMSAKLAFVLLALNAGVYALPAAIANTTSSAPPSGTTGEPGGISGQNDMEHIIQQLCQNQTTTKPLVMDKGKRAATPIIDPPPSGGDGDIQKLIKQLCEVHKQHNGTHPRIGTVTGPATNGSSSASPLPSKKRAAPDSEQPSDKSNGTTGPDGPGGKSGGHDNHGGQGGQNKGWQGMMKLIEDLCSKHTKGPGHGAPGGPKGSTSSNSTSNSTELGDSSPTEKRATTAGDASGHHEDPLEKLCSMMLHKGHGHGNASATLSSTNPTGTETPTGTENPTGTGNPEASSGSGSPGSSSTSTEASSPANSTDSPST